MRKLSVTEYLIAANQQQSTVTTYARLSDALREVENVAGSHTRMYQVVDRTHDAQPVKARIDAVLPNDDSIGLSGVFYVARGYAPAHAAILALHDDQRGSYFEIVSI